MWIRSASILCFLRAAPFFSLTPIFSRVFDAQFNTHYMDLCKISLIMLFSPFHIHFGFHQISMINSSVKPMIANKFLCTVKVFFPFWYCFTWFHSVWCLAFAAAGNLTHTYSIEPFPQMMQAIESRYVTLYSLFSCTLFTKALRETEPTVRRVGIRRLFKFEHRARL